MTKPVAFNDLFECVTAKIRPYLIENNLLDPHECFTEKGRENGAVIVTQENRFGNVVSEYLLNQHLQTGANVGTLPEFQAWTRNGYFNKQAMSDAEVTRGLAQEVGRAITEALIEFKATSRAATHDR
ncbi:MAG: hypothetical protein U1E36_09355 [Rickettsiales bacterium]